MKHWQIALAIFASLSASIALADDFKTINGKEYKNATVTRVEPDGIVVKTKSGITKIYFIELPKEIADKWLAPVRAAQKAAEEKRIEAQNAAEREREEKAKKVAAEREEKEKKAAAEREEKEKKATADLNPSLAQFQVVEQRAAESYRNATKGTLSGQVFVSTVGGENFKLGAVQVSLFARDAIDVLVAGLKRYADTNIQQLRPTVDAAKAGYEQAVAAERAAFQAHLNAIADDGYNRAWTQSKEAHHAAFDEYFEVNRKLNYYYSGDFYFSYLHSPLQTAETDADGKFVFEVPQTGAFVIAAHGTRKILDSSEYYHWLQPVTLDGQQQRVQNLSNNNLTHTTGSPSLIHTKD